MSGDVDAPFSPFGQVRILLQLYPIAVAAYEVNAQSQKRHLDYDAVIASSLRVEVEFTEEPTPALQISIQFRL